MNRLPLIIAMSIFASLFARAGEGELVKPYPAPRAEAVDQDGRPVKLEDFYKTGPTLVYFYPKAGTPGCTKQACSLRDAYEDLTRKGVQVIGVSMDKAESQKKFQEKNRLPFTLLADPGGKVLEAFGVGSFLGFASRQAYFIREGMVVWRDTKASTSEQAADVLRVIDKLQAR